MCIRDSSVSDRSIEVNEIITLAASQDPDNVPIDFSFDHGDGTLDRNSVSQAFYRAPGRYEVTLLWTHAGGSGSASCGTDVVAAASAPAPGPTASGTLPNVAVRCVISPRTVQVGQVTTLSAFQDPPDAPVAYEFDHRDGTSNPGAISNKAYSAPGTYNVQLRWNYAGSVGQSSCGTVTVLASTTISASDVVGRTTAEAQAIADGAGIQVRVVRIDDQQFSVTQDFIPSRLNLEIDNGVVTFAFFG